MSDLLTKEEIAGAMNLGVDKAIDWSNANPNASDIAYSAMRETCIVESVAKAQSVKTKKGLVEEERRKIVIEFDNIFMLAPYDNSYLRILIKDLYKAIKAGKWASAELGQALKKEVEDG